MIADLPYWFWMVVLCGIVYLIVDAIVGDPPRGG